MHLHGEVFEAICPQTRGVDGRVLEATVVRAVEAGREGWKIGAMVVVGDSAGVLPADVAPGGRDAAGVPTRLAEAG